MKHSDDELLALRSMSSDLGLELSPELLEVILGYLDRVLVVNESLNLTRITERQAAIRLHLLDSLSALPEVRNSIPGRMLDLGSGGGFPGVPLAIATSRRTDLLDSVGKKIVAVAEILDSLGLPGPVEARAGRAEELARSERGAYAVIVARAVSALPGLVELSSPLLQSGGRMVALQGKVSDEDLRRADAVAVQTGMARAAVREFVLPGGNEQRTIVVYERIGPSKIALPRRVGLAQHHPLA